jgi:tetratricopeptide (TPR) repeat protein
MIVSISFGYSQTNKSLIRSGDNEMEMENYSSAVYFYSQVINRLAGGNEDLMYHPYSVSAFYKANPKGGPKTFEPPVNPKTDDELEVLHKLADAYRLAKDYDNAEKWYAIAVENPKEEHPYAEYFYGYSLMKNGKYEEAKPHFEKMMENLGEEKSFGAYHLRQSLGIIISYIALFIVLAILIAILSAISWRFGITIGGILYLGGF